MIIRMTCNDNSFTDAIENFANDLVYKLTDLQYTDQQSLQLTNFTKHEFVYTEKFVWLQLIRTCWKRYIDKTFTHPHDNPDWYKQTFNVDIINKLEDKWENGEVVYYFTTNNKFIVQ